MRWLIYSKWGGVLRIKYGKESCRYFESYNIKREARPLKYMLHGKYMLLQSCVLAGVFVGSEFAMFFLSRKLQLLDLAGGRLGRKRYLCFLLRNFAVSWMTVVLFCANRHIVSQLLCSFYNHRLCVYFQLSIAPPRGCRNSLPALSENTKITPKIKVLKIY
jgi:hypothetical protein